ncbi:PIN domain-containing protein [Butyrivibrio proteoclasticus B316]|uniref:PIN domain-containing protein n=1 Tax=Butyrivibrio proteoclasticus (strain ATCC 51982 / DSM 14932 / B316) TaxID=515622 RepID=E0RZA0_BUTPB|nr:PIN domain-containing protein [Butyrivibrio proteoclasticus]ADL35472.1 PIN domain-containing protein [Butyrivibrio proteoclasticus B316]
MKYISSDTNIWLDFETISRTDLPFLLPCTYVMYKEALEEEVVSPPDLLEDLRKKGLVAVELTTEEFFYAAECVAKYVKISKYDSTALAIAKHRGIPLLTGDNALRKAAIKEGVEVIGTIGILDTLYEGNYINSTEYKYCLEQLLEHAERRLPTEEMKKRLETLK